MQVGSNITEGNIPGAKYKIKGSSIDTSMGGSAPPEPGTDHYFRPGGVDTYHRPDGTSIYLRPT